MSQQTLFDYSDDQVKDRVIVQKEETGFTHTKEMKIKASLVRKLPRNDAGDIYGLEYALKLLETDHYIFDMHCWKTMSRREVKKRFESGNWNTGSGHFGYVMRGFKPQGGSFEQVWQAIKNNRVKHWRWFLQYATSELESYQKRLEAEINAKNCTEGCRLCKKNCLFKPNREEYKYHDFDWWIEHYKKDVASAKESIRLYSKHLKRIGEPVTVTTSTTLEMST